ncbi:MAG: esterase family protein [Chlorobi bacterium]|nr:esterase family protein [Chlorobiota bacterium]
MNSKLMKAPVKFAIYLPPGYETDNRSYPVLYLLHGYTDDETGWIQFGEAPRIADEEISNGDAPPMIIVMPDGGVTWYMNDYQEKTPWADMFIKEFIPYIESNYRIRVKREFRAIAGLSMGGFGALHLAMRNTGLFATCVAMSAGIYTDEEITAMRDDSYENVFGFLIGTGLKDKVRLNDTWKKFNPLHILDEIPKEDINKVRWYIDCGDDDFLYKGNSALHVKMRDLGINHEYRVRNGKHEWAYWRSSLRTGLGFIGQGFHR